jgi:hypothetical protein
VNGTKNKQDRTYKQINFIGFQNNRHPSQTMLATIIKLLEIVSKGMFGNPSQNHCNTFLDCRHVVMPQFFFPEIWWSYPPIGN